MTQEAPNDLHLWKKAVSPEKELPFYIKGKEEGKKGQEIIPAESNHRILAAWRLEPSLCVTLHIQIGYQEGLLHVVIFIVWIS